MRLLDSAQRDFSALLEVTKVCSFRRSDGHFDRTTVISTEPQSFRLYHGHFDRSGEIPATVESKLSKTIYLVGLVQFLAIVGSVLAIVTSMLG